MRARADRPTFLLGCAAVVAGVLAAAGAARAAEETVEIAGADGFRLVGTLYSPDGPTTTAGAPAVLLVPMLGKERSAMGRLATEIATQDRMFCLTMDLRGHGESALQKAEGDDDPRARGYKLFGPEEWEGVPRDLVHALRWLAARPGVDPKRLGVVGASIGANAALVAAQEEPGVHAAVLVSPGRDYRGIQLLPALGGWGARPLLVITGREGDAYARETVEAMRAAKAKFELASYWRGHGTEILNAVVESRKGVRDFLKTQLVSAQRDEK